jgi:hypothetical protein
MIASTRFVSPSWFPFFVTSLTARSRSDPIFLGLSTSDLRHLLRQASIRTSGSALASVQVEVLHNWVLTISESKSVLCFSATAYFRPGHAVTQTRQWFPTVRLLASVRPFFTSCRDRRC